jgi:hypothetical protein
LSLRLRAFAPGCVRADPGIGHAGAKPYDVEPRAVSALAQSASTLAHPAAISAGASMFSWRSREAAGFPFVWLA